MHQLERVGKGVFKLSSRFKFRSVNVEYTVKAKQGKHRLGKYKIPLSSVWSGDDRTGLEIYKLPDLSKAQMRLRNLKMRLQNALVNASAKC